MCFWKKPITEPETIEPTSTKRANIADIYNIVKGVYPSCNLYLSDGDYLLCSYDDIAFFLAQDETNKFEYSAEDYDCDDFSYRLMGQFSIPKWSDLCLGICWTQTHAFNCFITEDKDLLFIEPQTDEISDTPYADGNISFMVI